MRTARRPSYLNFDAGAYAWKPGVDYRAQPELYRVGKGEQGVLICEPYKSEIGQHWRFRTPQIALASASRIYDLFEAYLEHGEFVGADMARKFLQMGYTRARRYANFKGGLKYDHANDYAPLERGTGDASKAEAAHIFYLQWKQAEANAEYKRLKDDWKKTYG